MKAELVVPEKRTQTCSNVCVNEVIQLEVREPSDLFSLDRILNFLRGDEALWRTRNKQRQMGSRCNINEMDSQTHGPGSADSGRGSEMGPPDE